MIHVYGIYILYNNAIWYTVHGKWVQFQALPTDYQTAENEEIPRWIRKERKVNTKCVRVFSGQLI